jgi:hypothetical protein
MLICDLEHPSKMLGNRALGAPERPSLGLDISADDYSTKYLFPNPRRLGSWRGAPGRRRAGRAFPALLRVTVPKPACGRLLPRSRPASGDGTARQLDVKRPTRVVEAMHQVAATTTECRQTVNWAANATQSKWFYTEPNAIRVARVRRPAPSSEPKSQSVFLRQRSAIFDRIVTARPTQPR